eukprot:15310424-Alexandrium_andersonii.AAC.1
MVGELAVHPVRHGRRTAAASRAGAIILAHDVFSSGPRKAASSTEWATRGPRWPATAKAT